MLSSRVGDKMFNFTKELGITGNLILLFFFIKVLIVLYLFYLTFLYRNIEVLEVDYMFDVKVESVQMVLGVCVVIRIIKI